MPKLRWGVLGVAGIAVDRVIPAMQKEVAAQMDAILDPQPVATAVATKPTPQKVN